MKRAEAPSVGLPPAATRIIRIVRSFVWLAAVGSAAALLHFHWLASLLILFITSALMSRRLYLGFYSVRLPSFDELVKGEVLSGASEAEAIKHVSQGEISSEILRGIASVALNVGLVTTLYDPGVERLVTAWFESSMKHSALWIVGAGAFFILLPYVVLVADRHTRETLFTTRRKIKQ
ncbi:MAG TPA: hypothetical protein VGG22_14850 [Candidatus Baltobacteraceae bacterium]|jgi:hypothetical protein